MANLKYRGNSTTPTKPTSTTAKNAPLTNDEIDGNLRSLNDSKLENTGWTAGDIFYADASGNLVRLPIGTAGQLLSPINGYPTWNSSSAILDTINVQQFSAVGTSTWVKPAGARFVHIIMYGAGSSGQGGSVYSSINSTKAHPGGFGGQGGSRVELWLDANSLSSSVSVTVGQGGAATEGNYYNNGGGASNFGSFIANGASAIGDVAGFPVDSGYSKIYYPSSVLSSVYGYFSGSTLSYLMPYGGGIKATTVSTVVIASANPGGMGSLTGGGGGGGGGINSNSTWSVGSDGGLGGGALFYSTTLYDSNGLAGGGGAKGSTQGANGANGGNGYGATTWDAYYGGNGGGGGAASVTGNGGNGGNGGVGAGGGGGGSCLSGFTPGLSGAGGNGYVKVTAYK